MSKTQSVSITDTNYLSRQGLQAIVASHPELSLTQTFSETPQVVTGALRELDIWIINLCDNTEQHLALATKVIKTSKVLIIADPKQEKEIKHLWGKGIQSIVTDRCSQEEISLALGHLSSNKKFYCNTILEVVHKEGSPTKAYDLSKRELQVIELIVKGHSSKDISKLLYLSPHTVNSHRKNILKKLDLKSPAELIIFALDKRLAKIDD
ncbi:hypothetical protein BFP72_07330 [Reichenbachiella sp. 5M10]|uniref:response regulator transcription factor n=1 Tax=Reichenbachiella sp. 5M10 TaxID=1889772 RepID=UPI000C5F0438|nr:response regulator transcription factor [Reichenbachiella sp. 5M10]PIB35221.1 hypothetical protein BFP72_07330 [Reichenbachiella sp. 5M10]